MPAPTRRTPNWRAAARAAPPRRALVPSARAQDALIVLPGNLDVAPLHVHLPGPVAIRRGPQRVYVGLRPAVRERYGSERRGMRCCVFRPDAGCLCLGAVARQGSSPALHLARKRRDERLVWATGRRRVGSGDPRSARPQFASGFDTEGQPSKGDRFRRDAVARMGDPAQPLLAPGVVDRVGARGASSVSRERLDLITRTGIAFMFRRCRACLRFGDVPIVTLPSLAQRSAGAAG